MAAIQSLLKAIDIISLFTPEEPRLSLSEISKRLDMPKSTTFNLLNTLASRGFIEKVDHEWYALGTAVIALTQAVRVNVELRDRAAPLVRALADATNETVNLTILDGDMVLYIYAVESSRRLLARTAIGDRAHLHATAVGKAILAFVPEAQVDEIGARVGLPAFTPNTLVDPAALRSDLDATRRRGYSVDNSEHELSTYCLGAPIFNARGAPIGAISISGTDPEILGARQAELAGLLVQTADDISRRMGYVPSTVALVAPALRVSTNR